jgi:hypothetical protein
MFDEMKKTTLSRRKLLQSALGAISTCPIANGLGQKARAVDYPAPVPEAKGLTAYQKDGSILVRYDNLPIAAYRAQPSLKYPYLCRLNGPKSGLSLTAESALPYPHHRGVWLGCDPLNGGNYWADNGLQSGQIRCVKLKIEETTATNVSFSQRCTWQRDGSNPLNDERQFTIIRPGDQHLFIDCQFDLVANEPISIASAKHSFFAMRAAADISPSHGGTLINSRGGLGAEGTHGKTASWCGFYGPRRFRPDVVEGIVFMDHPDNFGGNCPWFTREYGHLSPSPLNFLSEPWTLGQGDKLRLKYRVVLFVGTPNEAKLDTIYRSWLSG